MLVKSMVTGDSSEKASLIMFSRQNGLTRDIRKLFVRRGYYYSASSLRLLVFLSLSGGNNVGDLKVWLGRDAMPQCYVKITEGLIGRYGRGRGVRACYKLTDRGKCFVDDIMLVVRAAIDSELRNMPKKKPS